MRIQEIFFINREDIYVDASIDFDGEVFSVDIYEALNTEYNGQSHDLTSKVADLKQLSSDMADSINHNIEIYNQIYNEFLEV